MRYWPTELVAYSSNDERNPRELTTCKQMLRFVDDDASVHVRSKLRINRMIERKLPIHTENNIYRVGAKKSEPKMLYT